MADRTLRLSTVLDLSKVRQAWEEFKSDARNAGETGAKSFGDAFSTAFNSLRSEAKQGRQELAGMIAAGQGGSPAFVELLGQIKAVDGDIHKLKAAEDEVEKALGHEPPTTFFGKIKHELGELTSGEGGLGGLSAAFSGGIGAAFGGAAISLAEKGLEFLKESIGEVIDAGIELIEIEEGMELGFKQAGLSGEGLEKQMASTTKFAGDLAIKFGVTADSVKKVSGQTAFLGGVTGEANERITTLAIGIEKASGGFIKSEDAIKAFTRGVNDPEAQASIGRLATKFPQLATELKGIKDPAELVNKAMKVLGPTFATLEEQSKGPIGAIANLKNSFFSVLENVGAVAIRGLQPVFNGFTRFATFFQGTVAPAIAALQPVISAILQPIGDLFNELTRGETLGALFVAVLAILSPTLALVGASFAVAFAVIEVFVGFLKPFGDVIAEAFGSLTDAASGGLDFAEVMKTLGAATQTLGDYFQLIGSIMAVAIIEPFRLAWSVARPLVQTVGDFVLSLFGMKAAGGEAGNVLDSIKGGLGELKGAIEGIKAAMTVVISGVAKAFDQLKHLDFSGATDTLAGLGDQAGKAFSDKSKEVIEENIGDIKVEKLSKALDDAATIKGDLDKNGEIQKLLTKYNGMADGVEKRNLGAEIAKSLPEAVNGFDEVNKVETISTEKAQEAIAAHEKGYGAEMQGNVAAFGAGVQVLAQRNVELRAKAEELTVKLRAAHDPKIAAALHAELVKVETQIGENTAKISENIEKGKETGIVTGKVSELGAKFHYTAGQAKEVTDAEQRGAEKAKDWTAEIAKAAQEFSNMNSAAKKQVEEDIGALALARVKKDLTDQEAEAAKAAKLRIAGDIATMKQVEAVEKQLREQYGLTEKKKGEIRAKDFSGEVESLKLLQQERLDAIDNELLREVIANEQSVDLVRKGDAAKLKSLQDQLGQARKIGDAAKVTDLSRQISDFTRGTAELEALVQQRSAALLAGDQETSDAISKRIATLVASAGAAAKDLADADEKRVLKLKDLRVKQVADILKLDEDAFTKQTERIKGQAESLTGTDIETLRKRGELTLEVLKREAESKVDSIVSGSSIFQNIAKGLTKEEGDSLLSSQIELSRRITAFQQKRDELATQEGITPEQVDAQTKPLLDAIQQQQDAVFAAQDKATSRLRSLRDDFAKVLSLDAGIDPTTLTEQQRNLLAATAALSKEQRAIIRDSIASQAQENATLLLKSTKDEERSLREEVTKARLNAISDVAEREVALRRFEAQKSLEEEIKLVKAAEIFIRQQRIELRQQTGEILVQFNKDFAAAADDDERDAVIHRRDEALEALRQRLGDEQLYSDALADLVGRRVGVEIAAERLIREAEEKYLKERNLLYRFFFTAREAIRNAFNADETDADKKATEEKRAELKKQRDDLLASLRDGKTAFREYLKQSADLSKQESELQVGAADNKLRILKMAEAAGRDLIARTGQQASDAIKSDGEKQLDLVIARNRKKKEIADAQAAGDTAKAEALGKELEDINKESSENVLNTLADTGVRFGTQLVTILADSHDKLNDAGKAFLLTLLDLLEAQVPAISAMILGLSLAQPASIVSFGAAGFAEWAALTAGLELVVQVAKAAVQGFAGGGMIKGSERIIRTNEKGEEYMVKHGPAQRYEDLLEHINAGNDWRTFPQVHEWAAEYIVTESDRFVDAILSKVRGVIRPDAMAMPDFAMGQIVPALRFDVPVFEPIDMHQVIEHNVSVRLANQAQVIAEQGEVLVEISAKLDKLGGIAWEARQTRRETARGADAAERTANRKSPPPRRGDGRR